MLAVAAGALLAPAPAAAQQGRPAAACPPLLDHRFARLQDEKPVDLCQYAGQVVLVVNTASQCGFTPQYKSLEALYERHRGRGFVVLGFPANDFGGQEPGSNADIAEFCENQFAVRFPMFAKSRVVAGRGGPANPLHAALAARSGQPPQWNFHKYLIGRDGRTVISHRSATSPEDPAFVKDLERLLESK